MDFPKSPTLSYERSIDLMRLQSESNNLHNSLEEEHKMPYPVRLSARASSVLSLQSD